MYINNLELQNFKNISNKKFKFNKINLFQGNNGSGKSSTLESLVFLLSDYLSGKMSDYIKWGESKFSIYSEFDDFSYLIEYDKTTKRKLVTKQEEYIGSDAVKYLKEFINPTIALYSNISIQGQSTQLLFEKPTARLDKFKLLFGINDIDKAVENIKEKIVECRKQIEITESEISILKNKKYTYFEEYELPDFSLLEEKVKKLENEKIEHEKLKSEYDKYLMRLMEYNTAQMKVKEIQNNINQIDNKLKILEEQKKSIVIKRIAKPSKTPEEIQKLQNEELTLKSEVYILEKKYEAIKNGLCPTCGSLFTSDNIEAVYNEQLKLKEDYKNLSQKVSMLKSEQDEYEKIVQKNNINKEKLNTIQTNIQGLNDTKTVYEKTLNELIEIKKPDEVNKPYFDDSELESLKKELYIAKEKKENLEKIKEMNRKIKLEESENIKLINEKENLLDELRKKERLLETARKVLGKDFSSYLIDEGTDYVKNKMNELFARAYGRYKVTLTRDSKGVDFYYSSEDKDILTTIDLASGYEKQLLSVSFRLALATLHKLGIFIFDEIDSDSSEENSLRLYKTILSQKYSQIFCVTHKEMTKEYLQQIPYCTVFEF